MNKPVKPNPSPQGAAPKRAEEGFFSRLLSMLFGRKATPPPLPTPRAATSTSTSRPPAAAARPAATEAGRPSPSAASPSAAAAARPGDVALEFEPASVSRPATAQPAGVPAPPTRLKLDEATIRAEVRHLFRKSESDETARAFFEMVLQYRLEKNK